MSADWKTPITLHDIHRTSAMRGRLKARKRAITFERRQSQYVKREDLKYQTALGMYYRNNFSL